MARLHKKDEQFLCNITISRVGRKKEQTSLKRSDQSGSRSVLELSISNLEGRGPCTCTMHEWESDKHETLKWDLMSSLSLFLFAFRLSSSSPFYLFPSRLHSPRWKRSRSSDCSLFVELPGDENLSVNRIDWSINPYRMQIERVW